MKFHAYLFVDGSSSRDADIGAWAAIACSGEQRQLLYGIDFPTTISRCELRPVVEGLRWIRDNWNTGTGFRVCVYSDSEYTVKTLSGVYSVGNKNRELWAAVYEAQKGMQVTFKWRERNSLPYMTLCDGICGALRRSQINYMGTVAKDPRKPEPDMPFHKLDELEVEDGYKAPDTTVRDQP